MARASLANLPKGQIKQGFKNSTITVSLDHILPLKVMTPALRGSEKFKQIHASIREIGIIEPLVVAPDGKASDKYILLDGHLRLEALREIGDETVTCLVSTDDEAFTYNKHISRLSIIQEHRMILEAVRRGVPEVKIAQALNINVAAIMQKMNLLKGICQEVADLLKDKMVPQRVFWVLRRMKAVRQVEVTMLMADANKYSVPYAKAFLAATPRDQLVEPDKPKNIKGLSEDQIARMESEMQVLQREFRLIEESYGPDHLNLTLARGYLGTLLKNGLITRHLRQHHAEILTQFEKIADMTSLNGKETA